MSYICLQEADATVAVKKPTVVFVLGKHFVLALSSVFVLILSGNVFCFLQMYKISKSQF